MNIENDWKQTLKKIYFFKNIFKNIKKNSEHLKSLNILLYENAPHKNLRHI